MQRTRIDDKGLRSIVSIPQYIGINELTSILRTQVRMPPAFAFSITVT